MLTISKPLSAGQAQCYHQKEFTAKEQNYWSQRGVTAGEWQGRLAEQFGLAGAHRIGGKGRSGGREMDIWLCQHDGLREWHVRRRRRQ